MYDGRPFHWTEWWRSFDCGLDVRVTPLKRQLRLGTVPSVESDDVLLLGQEADIILKYVLQMPSLWRFPLEIRARLFNAVGGRAGLLDTLELAEIPCATDTILSDKQEGGVRGHGARRIAGDVVAALQRKYGHRPRALRCRCMDVSRTLEFGRRIARCTQEAWQDDPALSPVSPRDRRLEGSRCRAHDAGTAKFNALPISVATPLAVTSSSPAAST